MVNAAGATQQMLDLFDVVGIVHFGIAGNANNSMSIGDVTIPQQFAHTGIWDWVNPMELWIRKMLHVQLDFEVYNNEPKVGENLLGHIGFRNEWFYSESGNRTGAMCEFEFVSTTEATLVVGLRGSTGNTFVDNAAYRNFLFQTFLVSSVDMESSAVVMTSLSNGFPVIVIRGLSNLAGRQAGENPIQTFGLLAAINACKVVVQLIKDLPEAGYVCIILILKSSTTIEQKEITEGPY
ncbi:putative nucleoside phosphorylase domain-containing protein [Rosa chinensis]|uniref:Putative nucleoside phosphorylase domain-containing protein n=1 Tax=Rosa chinensis TaxID=74649 RepID=A0A2P6SJ12_ROSCH|nr:putative nucleoside phosphorylase domain-containing protein [Rosa chinensis]